MYRIKQYGLVVGKADTFKPGMKYISEQIKETGVELICESEEMSFGVIHAPGRLLSLHVKGREYDKVSN